MRWDREIKSDMRVIVSHPTQLTDALALADGTAHTLTRREHMRHAHPGAHAHTSYAGTQTDTSHVTCVTRHAVCDIRVSCTVRAIETIEVAPGLCSEPSGLIESEREVQVLHRRAACALAQVVQARTEHARPLLRTRERARISASAQQGTRTAARAAGVPRAARAARAARAVEAVGSGGGGGGGGGGGWRVTSSLQ